MIKREMCVCGHERQLHSEENNNSDTVCMFCICPEYKLDLKDFCDYINHEVSRRVRQINEYLTCMSETVFKEHQVVDAPSGSEGLCQICKGKGSFLCDQDDASTQVECEACDGSGKSPERKGGAVGELAEKRAKAGASIRRD